MSNNKTPEVRIFTLKPEYQGVPGKPQIIVAPKGKKAEKGDTKKAQSLALAAKKAGLKEKDINTLYESCYMPIPLWEFLKKGDLSKVSDATQ